MLDHGMQDDNSKDENDGEEEPHIQHLEVGSFGKAVGCL